MILFSVSVNKYGSGKAVSRMLGMGILTAELGDDVVEVLFRAGAPPFKDLHNGGNLPHIGDGRRRSRAFQPLLLASHTSDNPGGYVGPFLSRQAHTERINLPRP
jgi:hypothetical protein